MSTYTTTSTFTKTHAAHLASKIAGDLRQMQCFYNHPSDGKILKYIEEVVSLLLDGYLESVDYGFEKNNKWVVAVSYEVVGGNIYPDNNSGRIPIGVNIEGAHWRSYLRKSRKFWNLPPHVRERVEAQLPIQRGDGKDPAAGLVGQQDRTYFAGGVGIKRNTIS